MMRTLAHELFEAYFEARQNKRNTYNALHFEMHFESHVLQLAKEIETGTYHLSRSICFLVQYPVIREIFAADFRDRVVHHYLIAKLNPLFERTFIPDAYACRKEKGTLYGIQRMERHIRKCSLQYTQDCWILKLDIQGFFMNIPRPVLWEKLKEFILEKYQANDKERLLLLFHQIVHHDSGQHCIIKGDKKEWNKVPANKSLFTTAPDCGLPIGNLTSQILANFYLNELDHWILKKIAPKGYYGRYVDDFIIVHPDPFFLKDLRMEIQNFLKEKLQLTLHPKKIYLQHYSKGVRFLGAVIKPHRVYVQNRTVGQFIKKMKAWMGSYPEWKEDAEKRKEFIACLHSYLGILQHYKTFRLTEKIISREIQPFLKNDNELLFKTKLKDWVFHLKHHPVPTALALVRTPLLSATR